MTRVVRSSGSLLACAGSGDVVRGTMSRPGPPPSSRSGARASGRHRVAVLPWVLVALVATARVAPATTPPSVPSDVRDRAFAASGRVVVDLGGDDTADALVLDARGRIVVAGTSRTAGRHQVSLSAIAADGSVDATFAARGTLRLDAGSGAHVAALVAAGDGLIAAGWTGEADGDVLVLRVSPHGEPDTGFGARARDALRAAGRERALAVTVATDRGLVVGGSTRVGGDERAFLARLLPDGRIDPSFGDGGRAVLDGAGRDASVLALASDRQGRIAVAGRGGGGAFAARLAPSGTLDRSFARDGVALLPLERSARVTAAAIDPDGGAVLVARAPAVDAPSLALRVRPDGRRDERFAQGGVAELTHDGLAIAPGSVALGADGRVVIGGTVARAGGERAVLVLLAADGTRDETIAAGGMIDVAATAGGASDVAAAAGGAIDVAAAAGGVIDRTAAAESAVVAAVTVQPDGRVVAAGSVGTGAARDVAVARFAADEPRCGDGVVAARESCDDGAANGGPGSCCSTRCTLHAAGTACRPADGACDEAELCDGTSALCPEDRFARAGAPCRAPAGACDVAEVCSGTSSECPVNEVRAHGTVCRVATGACDLDEECDGVSGECPADARRTGECRASRGGCDPPEWCDGASQDCPADVRLPDGATCDDGDACTADDTCVADVCRGGPRDDFACSAYLCAQLRDRRRIHGEKPRPEALREFGLHVKEVRPARSVCVPAVTTGDDGGGAVTPPADADADADADVRAAGAGDVRPAYIAYPVEPARRAAGRPTQLVGGTTIEDRFGVLELTPRSVERVSLPAGVGAPEASVQAAGAAYQCQVVPSGAGGTRSAHEVAVRVVGEVPSERFALGRPVQLCYPPVARAGVETTGAADDAPGPDARVCYQLHRLEPGTSATMRVPFLAANRFQSLVVEGLGARTLCVPGLLLNATWDAPDPKKRRDPDARPPKKRRDPEARRPKRDRQPRPVP